MREFAGFLDQVGVQPSAFFRSAVAAATTSPTAPPHLGWYEGPTVLEGLDAFHSEPAPVNRPFRMPVQDVYKFTKQGDDRRIVSGTIDSGTVKVGDPVIFYPSGKKSRVKTIEAFNRPPATGRRRATRWASP